MTLYENDELRAVWGRTLRPGGLTLTALALEFCAFRPGAELLDLGCGPGGTLKFLREKGFEALGLDSSPKLLAEAVTSGPVVQADFHRLPLADGSRAGIFCECALSLARDKDQVLAECFRVLRPGGRLVLSDLTTSRPASPGPADSGPPDCFGGAETPAALKARLGRAGFTIVLEQDHSRLLKETAAELLWRSGSLAALKNLWGRDIICGPAAWEFGYRLLIAGKPEFTSAPVTEFDNL